MKCFFCDDDTSKGSFFRMDKYEKGDGLFGDVFVCNKCEGDE